jgi:hypothetical protein
MGQPREELTLQNIKKPVVSVTTQGQKNVAQTAIWDKSNYIFFHNISMSV